MQIIGNGFLGHNLADAFAERFPEVTAFAAGVSSTAGTASADFDREAHLLYEVLRKCREEHRSLLFFSTASAAMYGASAAVYGASGTSGIEDGPVQPPSVYGRHKLALESVVRSSGVEHLILRLSHVVGRHQRSHQLLPALVHQVMTGAVTVHQGAHRDLLDVRDLVHAVGRLLDDGVRGRVVNVASGAPQPVEAIVDGIERRLGARAQRVNRPGPTAVTRASTRRLRLLVPDLDTGRTPAEYLDRVLDAYLPSYASAHSRQHSTAALGNTANPPADSA
ncbi:NAD-dependent epimerase/dehydratase family protein [Wenjunlia tyrosinilytica]|uniref:NAD-dependent epimerase n=1 Tax=Wenjunlia tyrosinilytica TaxID=1544741 RepID=A0A918E1Z9_9ACTN|nr:SDR family oxidoreductase [Wenjunlia tyrosinilytica]GGO97764.1 NAD-dependent epimerase [Wenjunlia tyrosinilytica]